MPDREGPTLVTPEPFYTCDGCKYLAEKKRLTSIFNRYCNHVDGDAPICCGHAQTPDWCPLLNEVKGEENE